MSINRDEIIRHDCPQCRGQGYKVEQATGAEAPCDNCEGSGMIELTLPYRHDLGARLPEEIKEEFRSRNLIP